MSVTPINFWVWSTVKVIIVKIIVIMYVYIQGMELQLVQIVHMHASCRAACVKIIDNDMVRVQTSTTKINCIQII